MNKNKLPRRVAHHRDHRYHQGFLLIIFLATTTPKRSENLIKDAVLMLARLVTEKREVLRGSFAQNIQAADKQYKWNE